ncbi:MAG: hypothetical protein ACTSRP_24010 [Candidatus Helarchaeota archaeon]
MKKDIKKNLLEVVIFFIILFSFVIYYEWLDKNFLRGMEKAWSIYNETLHCVYIGDYEKVKNVFKNKDTFDNFREKLLSGRNFKTKIDVSNCFYIDICFEDNDCTGFAICPVSISIFSLNYGKAEFEINLSKR